jgi:hypothetical protein
MSSPSSFEELPWHDAKLLELRIVRQHDEEQLAIIVSFQVSPGRWRRARVLFRNSTIVKLDLDLDGKKFCADSISYATRESGSALRDSLERGPLRNEQSPLLAYVHFRIILIPPGGEINVFAATFETTWED